MLDVAFCHSWLLQKALNRRNRLPFLAVNIERSPQSRKVRVKCKCKKMPIDRNLTDENSEDRFTCPSEFDPNEFGPDLFKDNLAKFQLQTLKRQSSWRTELFGFMFQLIAVMIMVSTVLVLIGKEEPTRNSRKVLEWQSFITSAGIPLMISLVGHILAKRYNEPSQDKRIYKAFRHQFNRNFKVEPNE